MSKEPKSDPEKQKEISENVHPYLLFYVHCYLLKSVHPYLRKNVHCYLPITVRNDESEVSTFFIDSSSYFDEPGYNIAKMKQAVRRAGGHNVRVEKAKGREDEVVVFDVRDASVGVEDVAKMVAQNLETDWVYIKKMAG